MSEAEELGNFPIYVLRKCGSLTRYANNATISEEDTRDGAATKNAIDEWFDYWSMFDETVLNAEEYTIEDWEKEAVWELERLSYTKEVFNA